MELIMISQKAMTLLTKSIKHWKNLRDGIEKLIGMTHCPLCGEFQSSDCVGCPIYKLTGEDYCSDTPYDRVDKLSKFTKIDISDLKVYAAVCAELAFLQAVKKCCKVAA